MNITLIQVYAPTCDTSDEVIEQFYGVIQQMPGSALVRCHHLDGELKCKSRKGEMDHDNNGNISRFGLGERTDRGQTMVDCCTTTTIGEHHLPVALPEHIHIDQSGRQGEETDR